MRCRQLELRTERARRLWFVSFLLAACAASLSTEVAAQVSATDEADPRPRTDAGLNMLVGAGGGALGTVIGIAAVAGGTALVMQVPSVGPPPDFFLAFVTAGLVMGPIAPALGALGAGLLAAAVGADPRMEDVSASFNVCLATGATGYCIACAPLMLGQLLNPLNWITTLTSSSGSRSSPPTPPLWQNPSFPPAAGAGMGSVAGALIGIFVGPAFLRTEGPETDATARNKLRASGVGGAVGAFSGAVIGGAIGGLIASVPDEPASLPRGGRLQGGSRPTW